MTALSRRHAMALGGGSFAYASVRRWAAAADFPTTSSFGDVTVTKVADGAGPFSAARAFPEAPLGVMDQNASWLAPHFYDPATKNILFSYHAYLVRTPRFNIVVDGGHGNDKQRPQNPANHMRRGPFLANLRAAGVAPEQVHFVINSHFDADHTGWNTSWVNERWQPTYPKARYLFNRTELDSAQKRSESMAGVKAAYDDSIKPILEAGAADIITGDHDIGDGVRIVFSPGHTAGHHSLAITSGGRRAVLCGDILHNPIEILHPEWTVLFDHDKDAGRATRIKFVEEHTDEDIVVFAAHYAGGKLVTENGKRLFRPQLT
jgi:glyoxylase-like metal-dependent hydrolase (beta-lactamase superfamily II)